MRITIVQGGFLPVPPLLGGAVEKVWFSLGQEFAKRGHQVTHVSRLYGSLPPREGLNGVLHLRVKGFDAPRSRPLLWLKDFFYALRVAHMLPPADVLVTNTIWLPVLVRDANRGALYVHIGRYPKRQTRMYRRAKRLHTASNAVAQAIARQDSKSKAKIRVIPYPLPNAEQPVDVARTWNSRPQQILYVGRIHAEKGVHLLIDAFDRLVASGFDGWRLVIVGPWDASQGGGGSAYYRSLRRTGGSQGDRVEWLGPVFDQSLLIDHYRRSRLFVYPSLAETGESFGLAPLEAMACGCPALVSSLECFSEFVKDGQSGFAFDHRSAAPAEALCVRLKEIVTADRELLSVAVRAHQVARTFALPRVADLYLQDFQSLVNESGRLDAA